MTVEIKEKKALITIRSDNVSADRGRIRVYLTEPKHVVGEFGALEQKMGNLQFYITDINPHFNTITISPESARKFYKALGKLLNEE